MASLGAAPMRARRSDGVCRCNNTKPRPAAIQQRTGNAAAGLLRCVRAANSNAPVRNPNTADGVSDLKKFKRQLDQLRNELAGLIRGGKQDAARVLNNANYHSLKDQMDSGVRGIEQAALLAVVAKARMEIDGLEGSEALLEELSDIMRHQSYSQPLADDILEEMAIVYTSLDKLSQALECYHKCLHIREGWFGAGSPLIVRPLCGCANVYWRRGEPQKSKRLYRRAISILDKPADPDPRYLSASFFNLGRLLLEEGDHAEADAAFSRALKISKANSDDVQVGAILAGLARAKLKAGESEASVGLFRDALKCMVRCGRMPSAEIVEVRMEVSQVLSALERHAEAQELLHDNVNAVVASAGQSMALCPHLGRLAASYIDGGQLTKSESVARTYLQLVTNCLGHEAAELAEPLRLLALVLHRMGRDVEAEAYAEQAVAIQEATLGSEHPMICEALIMLCDILIDLGSYEESRTLVLRVLAIQQRDMGPQHPLVGKTLERLIKLSTKLGADTAALEQSFQAIKERESGAERSRKQDRRIR